MDTFVLQLATIFLPGILWARIDAHYASRRKPNQFNFILNAFAFGLASYLIVYVAYSLCQKEFTFPTLTENIDPSELASFFDEILASLAGGFIGAITWCYAIRYRLLMRLLSAIGASKSFGDEDVWEYAFNDEGVSSKAVYVRDRDQKLIFSGVVDVFSGSDEKRELILSKVSVIDDVTGEVVYTSPRTYLEYRDRWISIDFPYAGDPDGEKNVEE